MEFKQKLVMVLLVTGFSVFLANNAYSADCKTLFNKLDKQLYSISEKDRVKKLIAIEEALFKAIDQCRTKSGMFVLMGEVQIDMGQIPLAVVYGRKAVELDNQYWRAHKLLGSALMLNNESEKGLNALRRAVALAPDNSNTQLNLVSALIQNKRLSEALNIVNKIIARNESSSLATAYYLRSKIYHEKGLLIEADKDLKEARKLGFEINQRS